MPRKTALIGAAILTGVILLSLFILLFSRDARAEDLPAAPPVNAVVESPAVASTTEFEAELARREATLLDQLALREAAIAELDATFAAQLAALEDHLAVTNASLIEKSERVETLQADAQGKADEIAAADQAFQDELDRLQSGLAYEDAQIRAQIEAVYAQLQQAYDQLAAAQVATQPSGSGDDISSPPPPAQSGDYDDDHEDDDHEDDDHEDEDHEEEDHEDDHDDDDDGD